MDLSQPQLGNLLERPIRFRIPVFQRHYVWNKKNQWEPLWNDFESKFTERINGKKIQAHYTGSIVLYQENTSSSSVNTYSVIDGQQRLTTFQLFITAFREVCRKKFNNEDLLAELNSLVFNKKTFGNVDYENEKFKLIPTKFNVEIFNEIVDKTYDEVVSNIIEPVKERYGVGIKTYWQTAINESQILGAYIYFYEKLSVLLEVEDEKIRGIIDIILKVFKNDFQFVEIGLKHDDDPQMIFETMNGRGAQLSETDLIRNFVFMRANTNGENLDRIYELYWDEFDDPHSIFKWHETISRGRLYQSRMQYFIIDFLTMKLAEEIRNDQVFYHYKSFIANTTDYRNVEDELKELHKYSEIFKSFLEPSPITSLGKLCRRLLDFDNSTVFSLLLFIEGENGINKDDKNRYYNIIDSYITRRFICNKTNKNYNRVFLDYLKFIKNNKTVADFEKLLKEKTADTNIWPTDTMLHEQILERPIYNEVSNKKSLNNIFIEIEKSLRGKKQEEINIENLGLSLEHILPQNWIEFWPIEGQQIDEEMYHKAPAKINADENAEEIYHLIENRKRKLNSLGNITILMHPLNASISNGPYSDKVAEISRQSTLVLNTYFQDHPIWTEKQIEERSQNLFLKIKSIWTY